MVNLYEHYEDVLEHGCDKNCQMCDLYLLSRQECAVESEKKWKRWAKQEHEKFGEYLDGVK